MSNDILVFGVGDADHDANFEGALERIRERGFTIIKEKCIYKKKSIIIQGYFSSEHGIAPDPAKVTAIRELTTPKDISDVRNLPGMTNFCCRFIKNYAKLTEPLRELTKKRIAFVGTMRQERALERLRVALTSAPENYTKVTGVYTDGSPVGVAAVLTQKEPDGDERKVIAFASPAMSCPEQNYSQQSIKCRDTH